MTTQTKTYFQVQYFRAQDISFYQRSCTMYATAKDAVVDATSHLLCNPDLHKAIIFQVKDTPFGEDTSERVLTLLR